MRIPLFIDFKDKNVLILGGGKVGTIRAIKFLKAQANVKVVALEFSEELVKLSQTCDKLKLIKCDLKGMDDKTLRDLISWAHLIILTIPDIEIMERVVKMCKELGKFLNNAVNAEESDVIVLPCSIHESLSRMLIEALSLGVPLIATDVGGNKDIVINKENGFLINRKDVNKLDEYIKKIVNNKKLQSSFRKKSIEHFKKNFSIEVISKKLDEEYTKLF